MVVGWMGGWVGVQYPPPPCGGGIIVGLWVCQKSGWVGPSNLPPPPPAVVKTLPCAHACARGGNLFVQFTTITPPPLHLGRINTPKMYTSGHKFAVHSAKPGV